jgi:ABC-2 type transport system ATP-binding protein
VRPPALLARGRKVFEGTQEQARASLPGRLEMVAQADPSLPGIASAVALGTEDGGWTRYRIELAPRADPGDILEACTRSGFPLRGFEVHRRRCTRCSSIWSGPTRRPARASGETVQ